MRRLKRFLWVLLALAFLGISWLWERLHPLIRWIIDLIPLERVKKAVARFMDSLAPYPTLFIFLIPLVAVEPIKILAVWLLAKGQFILGLTTYIATDVLRLGLVSFLFNTCRDKLLSIPWFKRFYAYFLYAHEWAHAQVAPLKAALRRALEEAGLLNHKAGMWLKVRAIWRFARKGGFKDA